MCVFCSWLSLCVHSLCHGCGSILIVNYLSIKSLYLPISALSLCKVVDVGSALSGLVSVDHDFVWVQSFLWKQG